MATALIPYLAFRTEAREAMNFYHGVFGGDLVVDTFEQGGMSQNLADRDLVLHARLTTADGHTIMASDAPTTMPLSFGLQQIAMTGDDAHQLERYWEGLSEAATVRQPLGEAPRGGTFGMLDDRWDVRWMVSIAAATGESSR